MNAMHELDEFIKGKQVDYGIIWTEPNYNKKDIKLKVKSHQEFVDQVKNLNFEYRDGFGSQELFGTVVFTDNTWLTRGEYDGSEWWNYHKIPSMGEVMGLEVEG